MNFRAWALLLPGMLSAVLLTSCGKTGASADKPAKGNAIARPVRTARAQLRPMERTITVSGTLGAQEKSTLSAKVAGRLQTLNVDIGSVVRKGDLLAQVEPRDYELRLQQAAAALAQARASLGLPSEGEDDHVDLKQISTVKQAQAVLEEAGKNRERIKNLSASGISSPAELDTAQAAYTVAQTRFDGAAEEALTRVAALAQRRAEYEIAKKQLADASVRAPFDGIVQARPAGLGEHIVAGTPVVMLVKVDPLRLRLEVPERDSALVRTGQVVRLAVAGDTNVYAGVMARLSPALDYQSRMLVVEADVPSRGALRPGLFVRAEIIVNGREEGLSVPRDAIVTFAGLEKVIAVEAGKAVEKVVNTGRAGPDWIEVISGIKAGEVVVIEPGSLRTGQSVTGGQEPLTMKATSVSTAQKLAD